MGQNILYSVGGIIPGMAILYSLGNIVFTIGEFKENFAVIPRILIMMLSKVVTMSTMYMFILHYMARETTITGMDITAIIMGVFIFFEAITSNKLITTYFIFVDKNFKNTKFDKYVKTVSKKIFICNKLLYIVIMMLSFILYASMLYNLIWNFSVFSVSLFLCFNFVLYNKLIILKYIKSI